MKKILVVMLVVCGLALAVGAQKNDAPPSWAYVVKPADFKAAKDDGKIRHVPGSKAGFSFAQVNDAFFSPDWHPEEHAALPEVVAHGRKPDVMACGYCHRADGPGGPENANIMGLPKTYFVQQMADFKSGTRVDAVAERGPTTSMIKAAQAATAAEIDAAAEYFSKLKPRKIVSVVETETVPKTYLAAWVLAPVNDRDKEPIGRRIIETPKDLEQFEARDTHSQFVAYVPVGSVGRGKALATTGGADRRTLKCSTCHGPELKGLGAVPGIAGRSPSYLVRQMWEFQHGQRHGALGGPMKLVVQKLSIDDEIDLAAYLASLES